MSRYSLTNLTKPALIMVSTYMFIHVVAFFIQTNKKQHTLINGTNILASQMESKSVIPQVTIKAEPQTEMKIKIKKIIPSSVPDSIKKDRISPSGEIIP